eukprot:12117103-Heterocapsa_arctica.AAC.1
MIRVVATGRNPTMRYLLRTHGVSVAWLHKAFKNNFLDLDYELSSRMCADIYTKGFTDAAKLVEYCDLINIVDPVRLHGLIQHVAEVCAGLDDPAVKAAVIGPKTLSSKKNTPPPSGGDTQNPKQAVPATCVDVLHKLYAGDRAALLNLVQRIEH